MAGRGCTVCITILGGTDSKSSTNEELSLPVALHSPLSVLKEQLEELTGIAAADQVVILCDLSDVERNNDKLLEGRDYMSLGDCGIKDGAVMTLHALGLSAERYAAERKLKMQKITKETTEQLHVKEEDKKRTLETRVTAAGADHSYNGVLFDVKCNGPFEVDLLSVSVGGMLGRVRIFARDRPCEADRPEQGSSPHWWAHRESVSNIGWTVVADVMCRPSWDKPLEIKFNQPVTLLPHAQRGLYCHSSLPDDLGIQYQSYQSKESIVAANEHITLLAGLGHTGFEPFDEQHGWYRAWRGLSGSVSYRTKWKGWSPLEHRLFPVDLRRAVRAMLLCQNRVIEGGMGVTAECLTEESCKSRHLALKSCTVEDMEASGKEDRSQDFPPLREQETGDLSALQLHLLPKYLVYNILEYMHWDWFIGIETKRAAVERAKMYAARALLAHDRVPQRSNCLPGPISVPLSMLGDMTAAGQEHQMMLMIAQAISSGQQTINIGGMTLQLSQGGDNETGSMSTSSGPMLSQQDEEYEDEYENIDDQDDEDEIDEGDDDEDDDDDEHEGLSAYFEGRVDCADSDDDDDDDDSSSEDSTCESPELAAYGAQLATRMEEEEQSAGDDDDDDDEDNNDNGSSDDVVSLS